MIRIIITSSCLTATILYVLYVVSSNCFKSYSIPIRTYGTTTTRGTKKVFPFNPLYSVHDNVFYDKHQHHQPREERNLSPQHIISRYDYYFNDDDDSNDDDRHGKEPESYNTTNAPTVITTKIPSMQPSIQPTPAPSSTVPSFFSQSQSPSTAPTMLSVKTLKPTSQPSSLSSCHKNDSYTFGHVNDDTIDSLLPYTVYYTYDVESNRTMSSIKGESFTTQMQLIESLTFDLLIDSFFPECMSDISSDSRSLADAAWRKTRVEQNNNHHNIFAPGFDSKILQSNQKKGVIGMSSRPMDFANGESCNSNDGSVINSEMACYIIEGRFTLYFSDSNEVSHGRSLFLQSIQNMMTNGELDFCHPAIGQIRFRNETKDDIENLINDDDDDGDNKNNNEGNQNENIFLAYSSKFMIAIGTITTIAFFTMLLVKKYHRDPMEENIENSLEETESSSGDAFIRPNDDDLISCLSLQLTKSFESSSENLSSAFSLRELFMERNNKDQSRDHDAENVSTTDLENEDDIDNIDSNSVRGGNQPTDSQNIQGNLELLTNKSPLSDIQMQLNSNEDHHGSSRQQIPDLFQAFTYCMSSLQSNQISHRYCRYFSMLLVITVAATSVKVAAGILGTIGLGVQILATMTILVGVTIVFVILVYDQQALEIDKENWVQSSMIEVKTSATYHSTTLSDLRQGRNHFV